MSTGSKTHTIEPLHHLNVLVSGDSKPFFTAFARPHVIIPLLAVIALLIIPVIVYTITPPQADSLAAVEQAHADTAVEHVSDAWAFDAACSPFESLTHCISTEAAAVMSIVEPPM